MSLGTSSGATPQTDPRGEATPPSVAQSRRAIVGALVAACRDAGTTHVFGVPGGGSNLDVVGAAEADGLRFVLVHTETAAAVMAGVMGELTGAPGVCLATRGPGAASAVNGVAQALLDRLPLVLITDCVADVDQGRISHQRLDQQAMLGPVTKASIVLDGLDSQAPSDAVALALASRPGPVHVDIDPTARHRGEGFRSASAENAKNDVEAVLDAGLEPALELIRSANRPVLVIGVGAAVQPPRDRKALIAAIDALVRETNVPVLCTYKARGAVADRASWCAGVATGATIESPVLEAADLIIGVGFDPVELIPGPWSYDAPVVLLGSWAVDDSVFFGARLAAELVGHLPILVGRVAEAIVSTWPPAAGQAFRQAANAELLRAVPDAPVGLTPQQVVTVAVAAAPPGTVATVDAGAHMLVAMPLWEVEALGELLTSSGLATMGFALPAAVAAALVSSDRSVVCFTGDGGIGMALAELETLARLQLPVVVVVFNDSTLSLIAAKQQPEGHGGAAAVSYRATDFAAIATGCGMRAARVATAAEYDRELRAALTSRVPTLLDVAVDPSAYGDVLDAIRGRRPSP